MARITVADCLPQIHNPFDLAMLAAERARQLNEGAAAAAGAEGHKSAVSALREIAAGGLDVGALREAAIERRLQARNAVEQGLDTPEPPAGDGFDRRNAAAIAADVLPRSTSRARARRSAR